MVDSIEKMVVGSSLLMEVGRCIMGEGEGRVVCSRLQADDAADIQAAVSETRGFGSWEMSAVDSAHCEHNQHRRNRPCLVGRSHRQWLNPHSVVQRL